MAAEIAHLSDKRRNVSPRSGTSSSPPKILGAVQAVRKLSRAKGSARAVLTVLATYADADGSNVRPSEETIARDAGISTRTVRRALRTLEDLEEIVCLSTGSGRQSSRYRITLSPPVDNPVENGTYSNGSADNLTGQPGQIDRAARTQCPPTVHRPTIDREGGPDADKCPTHRGVEDPPPCRKCQRTREANEAIRGQLAKDKIDADRRRRIEEERARVAAAAARRVPTEDAVDYAAARRALRKADN